MQGAEYRDSSIRPPILSNYDIKQRVASLLAPLLNRGTLVDFLKRGWTFREVFEKVIQPKLSIELIEHADLGMVGYKKIFGAFDAVSGIARIDKVIAMERRHPRRAFVLWHEIVGHGFLQGEHLRREIDRCAKFAVLNDTDITLDDHVRDQLEVQANKGAAEAAAPMLLIQAALISRLKLSANRKLHFGGPGWHCLGSTRIDVATRREFCRAAASRIQDLFDGLSLECLAIRIEHSKLFVATGPDLSRRLDLYCAA